MSVTTLQQLDKPNEPSKSPASQPADNRKLWKQRLVVVGPLLLTAMGASAYLQAPSSSPPNVAGVRSARVWMNLPSYWRWEAAQGQTDDPQAIEEFAAVIRAAQEHPDHKCVASGVVLLERSFGRSTELQFLPGHSPEWYEIRYGAKNYRVPREQFIAAMKRLGVTVPLKCCERN